MLLIVSAIAIAIIIVVTGPRAIALPILVAILLVACRPLPAGSRSATAAAAAPTRTRPAGGSGRCAAPAGGSRDFRNVDVVVAQELITAGALARDGRRAALLQAPPLRLAARPPAAA